MRRVLAALVLATPSLALLAEETVPTVPEEAAGGAPAAVIVEGVTPVPATPVGEAAPAPPALPVPPPLDASAERLPIGRPATASTVPEAALSAGPRFGRSALACLLVGILLAGGAILLRKSFPARIASGRSGLLEVLARAPLAPKQSVVLVRVAGKVLVLGVGPETVTALSEVTAPEEVEKLLLREQAAPTGGAFRERLAASMRGSPMGAFPAAPPEGGPMGGRSLEGEIRSLERRVASWRLEDRS